MKILLILPSLSSGGLEKVITELAWYFSEKKNIKTALISLSKGDFFYPLPEGIEIHTPSFSLKEMSRPFFIIKLMFWLRRKVKFSSPDVLLSFGGKYNSFVLISIFGLPVRTFISDRSRPSISYGKFLDFLNPIIYKKSTGIIAQTIRAKELMYKRLKHENIRVIGNPIRINENPVIIKRENVILNVGRFITSKKQDLLITYFSKIRPSNWKVCFIGDGPKLESAKDLVKSLNLEDLVLFPGTIQNVQEYYLKSKIFAFTSVSEGFPNVLGEAMAAGLACISFDCEAGPSDLISDGENGFLVNLNDHDSYIEKLRMLIENEELRQSFGLKARQSVLKYSLQDIGEQYFKFLSEK